MTKKERKKYGLLPPKIAESDTVSLGLDLCGSGGSIYNKETIQNTLQTAPGSYEFVFGRDMIHNIAYRENRDQIQKRKQDFKNKSIKK
jgi:hypothetical protein